MLRLLLSCVLIMACWLALLAIAATFTVDILSDDSFAADASPGGGVCADDFGPAHSAQ